MSKKKTQHHVQPRKSRENGIKKEREQASISGSENNNNNKCLKRSKRLGKQGKKKTNNWTKLVQWTILSFTHKTPLIMFSLHFKETSFRWAWVENAWAASKNFLSLSSYQTTPFSIFSPKFFINPISPPNKHTLKLCVQ